jgi:hypothetical protein
MLCIFAFVAVRPLRLANARSGLSESMVEAPVVSKAEGRVESRAPPSGANGGIRTVLRTLFCSFPSTRATRSIGTNGKEPLSIFKILNFAFKKQYFILEGEVAV